MSRALGAGAAFEVALEDERLRVRIDSAGRAIGEQQLPVLVNNQ
jgi:hypothetical protein